MAKTQKVKSDTKKKLAGRKFKEPLSVTHPELAAEWDYEKNGDLTPDDVTAGSNKKVWWKYPYDDPVTGKHFDFVWEAYICNRASGVGCPYITGTATWPGYNDLLTVNPSLAAEWDYIKNGDLKPYNVSPGSEKKVWWLYPYDDPETGKHFTFSWQARVCNRREGQVCPFISGKAVWASYNDLATTHPELAKQWDYERNKGLRPEMVSAGSSKKAWWLYPYDDPKTGKHWTFSWQARINSRINENSCPQLSGKLIEPGFNDLASQFPKIAEQWHPSKNGNLSPENVSAHSQRIVWWLVHYYDEKTKKYYDLEWKAAISDRTTNQNGIPYLSGQAVLPDFNDLQSCNPSLAAEWHPTKNGKLLPSEVTTHSKKRVWWLKNYTDPKTGILYRFEWQATIQSRSNSRSAGNGCPQLSGKIVVPGFNDLASQFPEVAKQWHPTKNIGLTPQNVSAHSSKIVWWLMHYYDDKTKRYFDFEWKASVADRTTGGQNAPHLSGKIVVPGFNDLQSTNPALAAEWHPTKNGTLTPSEVTPRSNKKVWWRKHYIDPITDVAYDFEWQETILNRGDGRGCPQLAGKKVFKGFNDLGSLRPDLLAEWDFDRNAGIDPFNITLGSHKNVWWVANFENPITQQFETYHWKSIIKNRTLYGYGCPDLQISKGEIAVARLLNQFNIAYNYQNIIKGRGKLRDDFAIKCNDIILGTIEYNGEQHYWPVDFGGKGKEYAEEEFLRVQKRDKRKSDWLAAHGIPQLIIKYDQYDQIEELVTDFLCKIGALQKSA